MWIDWIRGPEAHRRVLEMSDLVICGPILQEVVQGFEQSSYALTLRSAMLRLPRIADPMPLESFLTAAEIYSDGRLRGFTIRSAVDCLIAAVAIEHGATVWHKDRD